MLVHEEDKKDSVDNPGTYCTLCTVLHHTVMDQKYYNTLFNTHFLIFVLLRFRLHPRL